MPGIDNPTIAAVVAQLARGSKSPVRDGVISTAVQPYTYDRHGGNFEAVPGPTRMDQTHPSSAPGRRAPGPQVPLMAERPGAPSGTKPGPMEGRDFGPDRLSHTGSEKGNMPDPEAILDMLMTMGLPPQEIQQILMEMGYGR